MQTKTCKTCLSELPFERFPKHVNMADGRLNKCSSCISKYRRARHAANPEKARSYFRSYFRVPENLEKKKLRAKQAGAKESAANSRREWVRRNRTKRLAQQAVTRAVRDGRLTRKPCEVCGATKAQAHHDDYSKPLDVRWLCTTHHAEWHRNNKPINSSQAA